MKSSKTAIMLFSLCGVGAFAVFSVLRSGDVIHSDECVTPLSGSQIRSIVVSEMQTRQVVPQSISVSQLENIEFGKLEIRINPDWRAHADDEYSASMYLAQFSEADFAFWALLSSCGRVNMAGIGKFSK